MSGSAAYHGPTWRRHCTTAMLRHKPCNSTKAVAPSQGNQPRGEGTLMHHEASICAHACDQCDDTRLLPLLTPSTWRQAPSAHEKTKAVRSAQRAVRPASAIAGLGERAGANISSQQQQHHGSKRGAGNFHAQRPASAAAAAAAAAAALRPQYRGAASAAVVPPKGARDIFPQDVAHQVCTEGLWLLV